MHNVPGQLHARACSTIDAHHWSKRDITHNINFFMNVPVTPTGRLTFEDGISAPGKYVEMRAEMDVHRSHLELPAAQQSLQRLQPDTHRGRSSGDEGALSADVQDTVLIANRGAIACRIMRTLDASWGCASVAVYSDADAAFAAHVRLADASRPHRPGTGRADPISTVRRFLPPRKAIGADAVHPWLRLPLGEPSLCRTPARMPASPSSARTPRQIEAFGAQAHRHRALAACPAACRLLPGSEPAVPDGRQPDRRRAAERIGFPVYAEEHGSGGGGIGMRLVRTTSAAAGRARRGVQRLAARRISRTPACTWKSTSIAPASHRGAGASATARAKVMAPGRARLLGAAAPPEGSLEETPAPGLDSARSASGLLCNAPVSAGPAASATTATPGTVEYRATTPIRARSISSKSTRGCRWSTASPKQVTGIDLVEWMILQAAGRADPRAGRA